MHTHPADTDERPPPLVSAFVVLAALAGGLAVLEGLRDGPSGELRGLDVALGAACCATLWWRHRWPVLLGAGVVTAAAFVATAGAANMFALYAVARRRPLRVALLLAAANVVAGLVFAWLYPGNVSWFLTLTVNVALSAAAVAWGALAQAQRRLVRSLEDRARRAEAEQQLRADQVRHAERARIAREMHDVVAHRVSLVALHAGGLEVRPDLPTDDVRAAAQLMRRSAQAALDELRHVVDVLREGAPDSTRVPTLADLETLVADSVAAGQPVQLHVDVSPAGDLPAWLGRTAYRVTQESLTNAIKHAPGARTTVLLAGTPAVGLTVRVRNEAPPRSIGPLVTGGGAGLLGLAERVALAGGTLASASTSTGGFEVDAHLPWPTGGLR